MRSVLEYWKALALPLACAGALRLRAAEEGSESRWLSFEAFVARKAWTVGESNACSIPPVGLKLRNEYYKPIVFNRHFMHLAIEDAAGRVMPPGRISPSADPRAAEAPSSAYLVIQPGRTVVVEWPEEFGFSLKLGRPGEEDEASVSNRSSRAIYVPDCGEYRLRIGYNCRQETLRVVDPSTGASKDHKVWHGSVDLPPVQIRILRSCEISLDPEKHDAACAALGRVGCYIVQDSQRWEQLLTIFRRHATAGTVERLYKPDFSKEMVIAHFAACDSADRIVVSNVAIDAASCRIDFDIMAGSAAAFVPRWKMTGIMVPAGGGTVVVSVPNPSQSAAGEARRMEWRMEEGWGDVTDGLQARLAVDRRDAKPGEDLTVSLFLRCVEPVADGVYVWDNKYSHGYRNDSYHVTLPSGARCIFKRPAVNAWDKNAPRPVLVKPGQDWELGGWGEGEAIRKSLKMLGLDTSAPGVYTIQAVFSEEAGEGEDFVQPGRKLKIWGGTIATLPATVRIK